nr:hypothetical protein Iba_scaffold489CG0100 [Ipomoea batatas]
MECAMAVDWAEATAASARGCREEYCEESVKVAPDGGGKVRLAVAMENCSGVGRGDMRLAVMVGDRTVVATMVVVAIAASESSDNIHGFSKQFLAIDKINFDSLLAPPPLAFSGGGACYLALPPPPSSPSVSLCLGTTPIHCRSTFFPFHQNASTFFFAIRLLSPSSKLSPFPFSPFQPLPSHHQTPHLRHPTPQQPSSLPSFGFFLSHI